MEILKVKNEGLLKSMGRWNTLLYGTVFGLGIGLILLSVSGFVSVSTWTSTSSSTTTNNAMTSLTPLVAVIFGVIGLIATDLNYLTHDRQMKGEIFQLLAGDPKKGPNQVAAELYAVLMRLRTFCIFHAVVLLGVMGIVSAIVNFLPWNPFRFILLGVDCCVALLCFLHWRSNAAAVEAFDSLRAAEDAKPSATQVATSQPDTLSKASNLTDQSPPKADMSANRPIAAAAVGSDTRPPRSRRDDPIIGQGK